MNAFFKEWKSDVSAGLVVFLVAIPLCLGIALASGAPLFSGIIAGFIGGIVVTLFSNSSLGVSGPAAGLVAIVVVAIQDFGFDAFLAAVAIAGVIQISLGILRCGIIGYYFPSSVIKGMLVAIGLIIILKQIPHAVGYDADFEGDLAFIQPDGHNTISELGYSMAALSPGAIAVFFVSLGIVVLWESRFVKNHIKILATIPGPLVAVGVGVALNLLFQGVENFALKSSQLVNLPIADDLTSFFMQFRLPDFTALANPAIYVCAATIAIVASIESLLCTEATDKLDPYRRTTNLDRELKAQGIGNLVSGLIGGLPVTQVIVRSSTNIQSGAKTRLAAFVHGLLLLVCVAFIPGILNLIPLSSLAAILCVVGYKLAHPAKFKEIYDLGLNQFAPFICTVGAIMVTDLLLGIGVGLFVAAFFILRNDYNHSHWLHEEATSEGHRLRLVLSENVSFLNKGSIMRTLREIPENSRVLIDATDSMHIDEDVLDIFKDFQAKAEYKNIDLEIRGIGAEKKVERPSKVNLTDATDRLKVSA